VLTAEVTVTQFNRIEPRVNAIDTHTTVIDALERAPALVLPLVREVPATILKRRPSPKKWSAHEHACHLAVVDRLFFERLDHMLASPSPVITPYDPGQHDADDLLLRMDLESSLDQYVEDRRRLVARLQQLGPAEWRQTAEHGEYSHYSHHVSPSGAARFLPCVSHRRATSEKGVGAAAVKRPVIGVNPIDLPPLIRHA
jgi:DinB superfamily